MSAASEPGASEEGVGGDVLVLAGRLNRHDPRGPRSSWLDRLERRGCRVQVLCLSRGDALAGDPRCFEMPSLGSRLTRGLAARSILASEPVRRPDLIHVVHDEMSEIALAISELARVPYILTVGDFGTIGRGLRVSRKWCRQLVSIRPDLERSLVADLGVPRGRVTTIAPGIDLPEDPARKGGGGRVPVVGTGGPLDEASGWMAFLQAARGLLDAGRDVEFAMAGRSDTRVALRRRAQQLGIAERVTFAEFPTVGAEYWSVLDVYCQGATAPDCGVALLQAMAHALPCVVTDVPGLRGLIEPGRGGRIVPPGDPQALGAAILDLLDHPEEARRLGLGARDRVRSGFDPEAEADRLVALYRDLVYGATAWDGAPLLSPGEKSS